MFDYMDVSPKMVFSVATALIPFLQNDDANRALMGSNMQRQAVPLLTTEAPVVGTGIEAKAAVDSGVCVVAKKDGVIERSTSKVITMKNDDGTRDEYRLTKFSRSNQSNCYNQKPIVFKGDRDVYKRQRFASSFCRNGIRAVATENTIFGDTSM